MRVDVHAEFVQEYLKCLNAIEAARRVGIELRRDPPDVGYYVYFLVESLCGGIVYVGKGRRKRMFQHLANYRRGKEQNQNKVKAFDDAIESGGNISAMVFSVMRSEPEAYTLEALLIHALKPTGITNGSSGQGLWAINMRRQMKAFEDWEPLLTPELRGDIAAVWGSPRTAYDWFLRALEGPHYTELTFDQTGRVLNLK